MTWFVRKRIALLAVAGATVLAISALSAVPASANDTYDGRKPSTVSGCGSNYHIGTYAHNRITAWNPLGMSPGQWQDYGWAEWRESRTGSCNGYQWVRLHLERTLAVYAGGYLIMNEHQTAAPNKVIIPWVTPSHLNQPYWGPNFGPVTESWLDPGTYDVALLYSFHTQACVSFGSYALVQDWDNFTYASIHVDVCA
jgi:hypothetical protein